MRQTQLRHEDLQSLSHAWHDEVGQENDSFPSLAVVLSNYNMGPYIDRAIASLLNQRVKPNQILLVNDGSTDDSSQRMRHWVAQFPNAHLYEIGNQGKARALNTALPTVNADFVLELDADDWLDPNAILHIRRLVCTLSAEHHLLYGNLRMWKPRIQGSPQYMKTNKGRQIDDAQALIHYPLPLGPRIYRTSTLKSIGGFPVSAFADGRLYEDVLVIRKLMNCGEVCYRDFTVYNVLVHSSSITSTNRSRWTKFVERFQNDMD